MPVDCGWKHLKLAALIIVVVGLITGGVFSVLWAASNDHGRRVREVEQTNGRMDERLKSMDKKLDRIEEALRNGATSY